MSYLEELLPEFRKGAKIRCSDFAYRAIKKIKEIKALKEIER